MIASATLGAAKVTRRTMCVIQTEVPECVTIAPGAMEFVYDYHLNADTIGNTVADDEQMVLQVARNGVSKFSSLRNMQIDSLIPTLTPEQISRNAERLINGPSMNIFKNHPVGRLTHTEKIVTDWFRYDEEMPDFDWQIGDSVRTILGYECRLARCSFRGREWTVYYTEDIPVMDGPWKLCGLPGLIMSARDSKDEHTFECIGIRNNTTRPLIMYDVPYNDTSRHKLYDTRHRYDINPYSYAETVAGIHVTVTDGAGNPDPTAYDPIELRYDYLERDWREKK